MGCDGGTIPKRHELVKTAKRPAQKDKDMDRNAKWSTCVISQQALTPPVMTCGLGKLYSKESVLEFLLDRSITEEASHIRSLKDVKELKLTPNAGYKKPTSGLADQYFDTQASKYVCPIVGLEMNGKYKFCMLWTCGCVLSERALKEVETENCHNCAAKFEKGDVVVLNAEGEDLERMHQNMEERREKQKTLRIKQKKEKKNEKRKLEAATSASATTSANGFKEPAPVKNGVESAAKKSKQLDKKSESGSTSSKLPSKKAKDKSADKNSNGVIDPTKSKVYKSLFTSSEDSSSRGTDQKAHWVTYNPYHL